MLTNKAQPTTHGKVLGGFSGFLRFVVRIKADVK